MPDVADTTPPAVDQTGNLTIWWVPTIANVLLPTAAELAVASAKRITYSFTSDGWNPTGEQAVNDDPRLTLPQPLQAFGTTATGLTMRYVDSTSPDSAAVVLAPVAPATELPGHFVERWGVPNATVAASGQKVLVHKVSVGRQLRGPRDGNGKFTLTQKAIYTGVLGAPVALG